MKYHIQSIDNREKDFAKAFQKAIELSLENGSNQLLLHVKSFRNLGTVMNNVDKAIPLSVKSKKVNQSPYSNTAYL